MRLPRRAVRFAATAKIGFLQVSSLIERAGAWFLRSGIQNSNGGVARYYRSDLLKNVPISNEITGYAVSTLAYLYQLTGVLAYKQAALHAAMFLVNCAWDAEASTFPFEYPPNGLAYFFDCGIIVRGLLAAWRLSGDPVYLSSAIECGRSMRADFRIGQIIQPIIHLPSKRALPHEPRWSATPGCYQLKSALAWHHLARATGEDEFHQAYESALSQALENAEAFLPGVADRHQIMDRLHPFCYFLEGLLPVVDRPECAAAYARGLNRVAYYLREIEPEFVRSDVYAQLLRARLYGHALGIAPLDKAAAAQEAAQSAKFQVSSSHASIDGGFGFGNKRGAPLPFVNPVSTAFCVQALALWSDYQRGALAPPIEALI